MDKIVYISDGSKLGVDIREQLTQSFEVTPCSFDLDTVVDCIQQVQPLLVVVFVKNLPYEAEHQLHLLLGSQTVAFVLIGSRAECHDFFGEGNIKKYIITPLLLKDLVMQVEDAADLEAQRPLRNRDIIQEEEVMAEQKHILLVDDDVVALRTITNYIKDYFRVSVAKSGTAAISFLAKEIPDLILLDYEMPVCNGVQTLQMIRAEEAYKNIPVFFLTGVSDAQMVKAAVDLKPEGYILKSISQGALISKIREFFE
jgi:CheY-like chemotaxis protein